MPPIKPHGSGPTGTDFVNWVASKIGLPYIWGGTGPSGFDCSGLVWAAATALGIPNFPRTSEEQWNSPAVQHIDASQLQAGDLIFMNFPGEAPPGHVVVWAGNDTIIQAPSTGQLVQKDSYSQGTAAQWGAQTIGYGRIVGLDYSGEGTGWSSKGPPVSSAPSSSGGSSFWSSVDSALTSILGTILPGSTALAKLIGGAGPGGGIATLLAELIQVLDWSLHPAHWIRLFCGLAGGVLVLMGIWTMTHVGGEA